MTGVLIFGDDHLHGGAGPQLAFSVYYDCVNLLYSGTVMVKHNIWPVFLLKIPKIQKRDIRIIKYNLVPFFPINKPLGFFVSLRYGASKIYFYVSGEGGLIFEYVALDCGGSHIDTLGKTHEHFPKCYVFPSGMLTIP